VTDGPRVGTLRSYDERKASAARPKVLGYSFFTLVPVKSRAYPVLLYKYPYFYFYFCTSAGTVHGF